MLRTAWTEAWDGEGSPGALPMPLQFMLTADAQARMHRYADHEAHDLVGTPVGQIVGKMNEVRTTRELMDALVREFDDAAQHVAELRQTLRQPG
jgi:hypothetical protein